MSKMTALQTHVKAAGLQAGLSELWLNFVFEFQTQT